MSSSTVPVTRGGRPAGYTRNTHHAKNEPVRHIRVTCVAVGRRTDPRRRVTPEPRFRDRNRVGDGLQRNRDCDAVGSADRRGGWSVPAGEWRKLPTRASGREPSLCATVTTGHVRSSDPENGRRFFGARRKRSRMDNGVGKSGKPVRAVLRPNRGRRARVHGGVRSPGGRRAAVRKIELGKRAATRWLTAGARRAIGRAGVRQFARAPFVAQPCPDPRREQIARGRVWN